MISNAIRRLLRFLPSFQRIKKQDQYFYSLKKSNLAREFHSSFPRRYCDAKCSELRNRLASVPVLQMLKKEEERVRQDLCCDMDERLIDVGKWFSKVFAHNANSSRKIGTGALLKAFCTYGFSMDDSSWNQWDSDKWREAVILAWCVELLHVHHNILDDIVDRTGLRKGRPCWNTKPDVGMRAVIDALFLLSGVHKLLQKYFAGSKCYMNLVHAFFQANHYTLWGQVHDTMFNQKNRKPRFQMFTLEEFQTLAELKSAFIAFCLPIHLAIHLAGECSAKEFEFARALCFKFGMYFQAQDDCIDCFEKPEVTGDIANDIPEGRLTWCSAKFLQVASESMKREFFENYGIDDNDAIAKILELYRKANLSERFKETEAQLSAEIRSLIESKNDIRGVFFIDLFEQIQKGAYI